MNFRKISERGRGGVISDLKKFIEIFFALETAFFVRFAEKIAMKFSEKGAGGGQRPFGNFPEIHSFWRRQASLMLMLS